MFTKAKMEGIKLRMALSGPTGSGKTFSALSIATHLGSKVAVIDSENGSASKYADRFSFDVMVLDSYEPQKYIQAIRAAANAGYDVLIVDSLSHAWNGTGGLLEQVDNICHRMKTSNSMLAWKEATPIQNEFIQALLKFPGHLIATIRVKTDYVIEKDDRGKSTVKKVGLCPVQRDGVEYEFDIIGELSQENVMVISKSRNPELQGSVIKKPGKDLAEKLLTWMKAAPPVEPSPAKITGPNQKSEPPVPLDIIQIMDLAKKLKLNGTFSLVIQEIIGRQVVSLDQCSAAERAQINLEFRRRLNKNNGGDNDNGSGNPPSNGESEEPPTNSGLSSLADEIKGELNRIMDLSNILGHQNRGEMLRDISVVLHREVKGSSELSANDRKRIIREFESMLTAKANPAVYDEIATVPF
ncbi:MAG: AAA family ATPase [Candidatus Riflebacteria bacterium]|nr:AAA family ATPase [Candidatus Riflebacteria bacterium]